MLPFAAGRAYVRKLKLGNNKEWKEWSKSAQRLSNIPGCPDLAYRDDGWISWPDWLGNGTARNMVAPLPFTVARAYVRKLKLRSTKEWNEWSKSGQRPSNIPSNPQMTYRDDGWISWPDWLVNGSTSNQARHVNMLPFTVGRAYVRKLKLRSKKEWNEWSKKAFFIPLPGCYPSNNNPLRELTTTHHTGGAANVDGTDYGNRTRQYEGRGRYGEL